MFNRQSIPPEIPNQLKPEDSLFNKMHVSGKKSSNNKISIYSKRSNNTNTNSPQKKQTQNSINLPTKSQYRFLQGSGNHQASSKFQTGINNIQLKKNNTFKQQRKVHLHKQYSEQTQNNPFYSHNSNHREKQPLSQLKPKQTQSQTNQSSFDISFVIGGSSQLNLQSNSRSVKPEIMMKNMLQLMQEQIVIAKNAYYQKTSSTLKANAKLIQQVNNRLIKNEELLKKKDFQIKQLKNKLLDKQADSPKKSSSSTKNIPHLPPTHPKTKKQQQSFLLKKIADLQKQVAMILQKPHNFDSADKLNNKIVTLQTGLVKYFSSKFVILNQRLSNVIKAKDQKTIVLEQRLRNIQSVIAKQLNNGSQKWQQKLRQMISQVGQTKTQFKVFVSKEFKYQNFKIVQLQRQMKELKAELRQIEGIRFENEKLLKILQIQLNQAKQTKPNVVQTYNNNNNFMNQGEKTVYRNVFTNNPQIKYRRQNPNITQDSIISMNFSQTQESLYSCQNQNAQNAFSKILKNNDMKQTNAPIQNSPFSNKHYFMPTKVPHLQKIQVQSSVQPFLKMNNPINQPKKTELLTPKRQSNHTLIHHKQHSNSYWSISQLQDIVDPVSNNEQVNDFDDDEFYYPLQQSKSKLFASRISKNNSKINSPMMDNQQSPYSETTQKMNILLSSKKQSHLYHLTDDYQNFSEQEQEDYRITHKNKHNQPIGNQKLSFNQQKLLILIKTQKYETPLKVKFDKRGFLVIKGTNDSSSCQRSNGKQMKMQYNQIQKLAQMGVVTILSVY